MSIQNKTVMIRIAKANLKAEKTKNYFVGSVIALAAFLLTVVMTFGYNSFTNLQMSRISKLYSITSITMKSHD